MRQTSDLGHAHTLLRELKRNLHTAFPRIKSAHLSEAVAASCGYNSHAALLSAIERNSGTSPWLAPARAGEAFAQRLHELGYPAQDYSSYVQLRLDAQLVTRVQALAAPEPGLAQTSDLERCAGYGIVMRTKANGDIFATHVVAGALGPFASVEAAAQEACATWL